MPLTARASSSRPFLGDPVKQTLLWLSFIFATCSFAQTLVPLQTLEAHQAEVSHLALSPDGHYLAFSASGAVYLYDLLGKKMLAVWSYPDAVRALSFAPQSSLLAVAVGQQVFVRSVFGNEFGSFTHLDLAREVAFLDHA